MIDKKISVIVPIYNSEKFLKNCLNCLINQTYKNIEIILVNDGSKGNCKEIYEEYHKKDERIKYIEHEKNMGLFQARITGVNFAKGDYIAFLDSDDHVTTDFYRALIFKAEESKSDIVFSNMIIELNYENDKQIQYNLFDTEFDELNGEETLDEFFNQEGLNFSWHTTPNKIYSRRIWNLALEDYKKMNKHLVMTEDFSFSSVLFFYAQKVSKVNTEAMFYCKHEGASTSVDSITFKKIEKNLTDLATSFAFVEDFLKSKGVYEKYEEKFKRWKALYCKQHKNVINDAKIKSNEKEKIKSLFEQINSNYELKEKNDIFSSIQSEWNNELDKVKKKISKNNIKCVSFDIFDTLIVRPFYAPKDLFLFLNKFYRKLEINSSLDFSVMREYAEVNARKKINIDKQDISIDEIYDEIGRIYNVGNETLSKMKSLEIEYEIRFCERRETAFQLYQLAKYLGKKVICTSDMYLGKDVLKKILEKNGYDIDDIYVSCDVNKAKTTIDGRNGDLFKYVIGELGVNADEIIHIGDNKISDYENPKKNGMESVYFRKAISIATDHKRTNNMFQIFLKDLPFWEDNVAGIGYLGIRTMLAMIANKYFDNPYRSFNLMSNFNGDPALVGYYALGMYIFGIAKWIVEHVKEEKYDSIVFMARDGYLPMEAYKILSKIYNNLPEAKYLYISRKALIPAIIQEKNDYYKIPEVINISTKTPKNIFRYVKDTVNYDEDRLMDVCSKNGVDINKKFDGIEEYNRFAQIIIDNFYDAEKHERNLGKLKAYYESFYQGKSVNFDVGYSGRPEYFISKLCKKGIDTLFINTNSDEASRYANKGNFKLETFFDYKPHLTGFFYEKCISAMAPSCIGYDFNGEKVNPIFEEFNIDYEEQFVIGKMQRAALKFIQDIVNTFENEIDELYYQKYYLTIPVQEYVHSASEFDRRMFNSFYFEDDMRENKLINMNELWNEHLDVHNQHSIDGLVNGSFVGRSIVGFDLSERGRLARGLFYLVYDRVTLRRKIDYKLRKHKKIQSFARKTYHVLRKILRHK